MKTFTSEEIAKKYQELTRITPTDERYIWRTQIKWVEVGDILNWLKNEVHRSGAPTQMIEEFEKQLRPPEDA